MDKENTIFDKQRTERIKFLASGFNSIDAENLEQYFSIKFDTWLYNSSGDKHITTNDKYLRPNLEGTKLTNVRYSGKSPEGFELTENKFIEIELQKIDNINIEFLSLDNSLKIVGYKQYLEARLSPITVKNHPEIFMNNVAFHIFQELFKFFGNTKNNLANYSYVYHAMADKRLIDNTKKQNDYFIILDNYNIEISEIKGKHKLTSQSKKDKINAVLKKYENELKKRR